MYHSRKKLHQSRCFAGALSLAICVILCAAAPPSHAAAVWTQVYGGDKHGNDFASAAVPDGSGGVVVTGQSVTTGHHLGITTIDYGSSGSEVWSHSETVPNANNYVTSSVALDPSGDATVAAIPDNNPTNIAVVASYTPTGTRTRRLEVTLPYTSTSIVALQSYADGDFSVEGNDTVTDPNTGADAEYWFVARFNSTGSLLWDDNYSPVASNDNYLSNTATSAALDSAGDLVVAGTVTVSTTTSTTAIAVRKYDASGNVVDSTIVPEASGNSASGSALVLDGDDNAYIAGGSLMASNEQLEIVKLSTAGAVDWQTYYGAPNDYDYAESITLGNDGDVIAGGQVQYYGGKTTKPYSEAFFVKLDSDGNILWTHGQHKVSYSSNIASFVYAIGGTDSFWAVDNITDEGNTTVEKTAVDQYAADGILTSSSYYDGSSINPDVATASGAAYDPAASSLFVIGIQSDAPASDYSAPNYNWFTQKY